MNTAKSLCIRIPAIMLSMILVLILLLVSALAAEPATTAIISVEKQLLGDRTGNAEKFTFILAPDDKSYPMPEGENGNALVIQGAGIGSFGAITYTEPGNYTYTLREKADNAANYTYDPTVYKVTVYVTTDDAGQLTAKVWMNKDGATAKAENAAFVNTYKAPGDSDTPQTGDPSKPELWISLAGFSAAMLLLIALGGFHKRKAHRQP